MDAFKKLTEEVKKYLGTKEYTDLVEKTKASDSEDSGTFEVIISTADQDRQGEIVDQKGWDLENYMKNPIVLWGHDYYALPIGVADEVKVIDGQLVAKGRFASMEANPFAQQVRKLYDQGIVKTTSVGFIAKKMTGNTITEAELLEFSFVPVPANPYAISMRTAKELGIDVEMLSMKGMSFKDIDTDEPVVDDVVPTGDEVDTTPVGDGENQNDSEENVDEVGNDAPVIEPEPTLADVVKMIKGLEAKIDNALSVKEQGVESDEVPKKDEPVIEDTSNAGSAGDEIEKWLKSRQKVSDPSVRQVLRIINNITSESLAEFNKGKSAKK